MDSNIIIPKHIGIIMDGNGRWAKKRMLPRNMGHKKGAEVFQDITRYCNELGLESVTFYAFSTENWKRPVEEVNGIMTLLKEYLVKAFDYEKENNRIVFLGDKSAFTFFNTSLDETAEIVVDLGFVSENYTIFSKMRLTEIVDDEDNLTINLGCGEGIILTF